MRQHTKEPWEVRNTSSGCVICEAKTPENERSPIVQMGGDPTRWGYAKNAHDDARRIVACVNACRGMSNENLSDDGVIKMHQHRDQLLTKLEKAEAMRDRLAFYSNVFLVCLKMDEQGIENYSMRIMSTETAREKLLDTLIQWRKDCNDDRSE